MLNKSAFVVLSLSAVLSLAGCASQADSEPTSSQDNAIFGALTSPIGLRDRHMVGTWVPAEPATFHGKAASIHFTDDNGRRGYRFGNDACTTNCASNGSWFVTENPIVWFFAGTYIEFRPTGQQESSLFVARGFDGEITLVDTGSWDWKLGRYANVWHKNPTLTVGDL